MTTGVGGSTAEIELDKLSDMTAGVEPIKKEEFLARVDQARLLMQGNNFAAIYLNAGTNMYYFTGTQWSPSERLVGVILSPDGRLDYIAPEFEKGTLTSFMLLEGDVQSWEEHESPYELFGKILESNGIKSGRIGMDQSASFFLTDGVRESNPNYEYINAKPVTAGCRMCKSDAEIAIMQRAKNITLEVQKAAARILYPGISAEAVIDFIDKAFIKAGISSGSYFCIVLFAEDSQYPHGVPSPQSMKDNNIVLIDTGCQLEGYIADITRTYVYGEPTERHREMWNLEKATQKAAFDAAQISQTCASVDTAARKVLEAAGLGPDYTLPSLPHRVGHGTGLDIHEYPYLVRNDLTKLRKGMVVSIEPMICLPGEFGVRHEDHFYMTNSDPKWFTEPTFSIDDPFGYEC